MSIKQYETPATNTWCPGCGNYAILMTVKQALAELEIHREDVVAVSGIGCHGKFTDYIKINGIHTIHGRVLPVATGIKLSNDKLTVLGFAGDGDAFNIGIGHFPHAARRNVNMAYIIHNNLIYGLTTGQISPTSKKGFVTKTSPRGEWSIAINPLTQALTSQASYVARVFAGEPMQMKAVLMDAIKHEGFALVDVLQPCVTFNKVNSYQFYKERVYKLEEEKHDTSDWNKAYSKAEEWGERIPIGAFYKENRPCFKNSFPALEKGPLVDQSLGRDMNKFFKEFM
jgi:2-oxoglutarate ferredoxin oxidoreductase subunit beta